MAPQVAQSDAGAGINRWWTYEERPIPGIGKAMVNVGTGNLLIQATDVDVPERGLDLVMQRTYNSQSLHDANGDDGADPAIFGNGWTNTYDAHMVARYSGQTLTALSVYDIDGTRCDYTPDQQHLGQWVPCTGEHATLEVDPNDSCSYWWIKKSGTAYWFHEPQQKCNDTYAGIGRVYAIYGRNQNNNITLSYSFVPGQPNTTPNITEIDVEHSNGQVLKMTFAKVGTGGPNELATITRPDGQLINYYYDSSGDLQEVDRPGNDAATILPETYGIQHPIQFACGPRATISKQSNGGNGKDGSCLHFDYDSNTNLIDWIVNGVLNFDPGDGYGMLQPGQPSGWQNFYTANFVYGSGTGTPCGTTLASTTTMCDQDGHSTVWTLNGSLNVTQTQVSTGPSASLITNQGWDTNNNLMFTTDARGNETTYGYDTNGNTVMVLQPSIASSQGQLQPMSLYSYDGSNNIISYCDPVSNVGKSPPSQMTDNLCPTTSGSGNFVYTYTNPSPEPYGELTDIYTPCYNDSNCADHGNHTQIAYDPSSQGGSKDYGLPTKVWGTSYSQKDGTTRAPEEDFTYTANGLLKTYVTGQNQGNGGAGTWTLTYDIYNMNRVISRQDPDGNTSHICYNYDGSTAYTETPYQYSLDQGGSCVAQGQSPPTYAVAVSHDTDGNVKQEVHHHGGTYLATFASPTTPPSLPPAANSTQKYYDGEDRLVEVIKPKDPYTDVYTNPWVTRYYYDITKGNGSADLTFQGKSGNFAGYGNLYKTVELLPSSTNGVVTYGQYPVPQQPVPPPPSPTPTPIVNQTFADLNATAFDALDRPVAKYRIVNYQSAEQLATELLTYDYNSNTQGLLYSDCQHEVSECKDYTYDRIGHTTVDSFSGGQTPLTRDITYDPDGRTEEIAQQGSGGDSDMYTYDLDGRLLKAGKQSGENISYSYFADGKRRMLSGSLGTETFDYSYAPDGTLEQLKYNIQQGTTRWGHLDYTLSAAGRVTKRDDYDATSPLMETLNSYSHGLLTSQSFPPPPGSCASPNPPGSHASMMYSADGELLGQLVTAPCSFNEFGAGPTLKQFPQTWQYNRRGEVIASSDHNGTTNTLYANGVQVAAYPQKTPGPGYQVIGAQWDARMGAAIGSGYANWTTNSQNGSSTIQGQTSGITFDRAGRNVQSGYAGFCNNSQSGGCQTVPLNQTVNRTYDVENHVIGSTGTYPPGSLSTTYVWGANGHPWLIGSSGASDAAYWDGNTLLYSRQSSGSGGVDDVKLGNDGEYAITDSSHLGVTFYDRGLDGSVAFCHNTTGGSGGQGDGEASMSHNRYWSGGPSNPCGPAGSSEQTWGMQYPLNVAWNSSYAGSTSGVGNGWTIGELRADGINDGVNTIQGTRAYDATAGQWTTPDVFSGVTSDPMSEKAYMWNENNPVGYSDPSGYTVYIGNAWIEGMDWWVDAHAFVQITEGPLSRTFEYGPKTNYFSNLTERADYGTTKDSPLSGNAIILDSVNGLSGAALDSRTASVFGELSAFLQLHPICYCDANSNTAIAAGLSLLGLSPQEIAQDIKGMGAPDLSGSNATTQGVRLANTILLYMTNGEANLGLFGSNGLDYCGSCGWSGKLQ